MFSIKTTVKAFSCFYVLLYSNLAHSFVELNMLNVNNNTQGDAHLLVDSGFYTLIDAGQRAEAQYLLSEIRKYNFRTVDGYRRVDVFFPSHPHNDHVGGYIDLIENGYSCTKFYHNPPPAGVRDFAYNKVSYDSFLNLIRSTGCEVIEVSKWDKISTGPESYLKVLHAQKGLNLPDGQRISVNDYSVIMRWSFYGRRVLFTGDLNRPLGLLLAGNKIFEADIFKVPHHGVSGIAPDDFFDTVMPSLLLSPMPAFLWLIERSVQLREWLDRNPGTTLCSNGFSGTIRLSFTKTGYVIANDKNSGTCIAGAHKWWERSYNSDPDEVGAIVSSTLAPLLLLD